MLRPEFPRFSGEVAGQMPLPPDQVAFMNRLKHVRGVQPLPDFSETMDHTGVVVDRSGLADRINVGMSASVLEPFVESGERPQTVTFAPRPMARFGKERSYRGAFFGELELASESGQRSTVPVVVKQYPIGGQHDAVHNAVQECAMLEYVKALGLQTVEVVGVIADRYSDSPVMYVLTRQKQGLESLDELSWRGVRIADMPDRLHPVIDTLSSLQGNLAFQGDPKFKNIGLGEDGSPIVFDLEHATSVRDLVAGMTAENEDEVIDRMAELMGGDFGYVADSLQEIVYPNLPRGERPRTPAEQFDFEYTHVMEPCLVRIMEGESMHKDVLRRVHARVVQQRRHTLLGSQ